MGAPAAGLGLHRRRPKYLRSAASRVSVPRGPLSSASPSAFPACVRARRDVTLRRARAARATPSAARTAPARARSARSSPGIHQPDGGHDRAVDGAAGALRDPARRAGAPASAMVHQELAFCDNLTVGRQSLPAARCPAAAASWTIAALRRRARSSCSPPSARRSTRTRPMRSLSVAEQQLVQIAAAVGEGARGHHLRRADQQPWRRPRPSGCTRCIGALRARGRDAASTCRTGCRRSSRCATPSRCCATDSTWPRSRPAALDRSARSCSR